jgi:hypothetical protein
MGLGLALLGTASAGIIDSFLKGSTLTRGGRRISRAKRPGVFWFNVGTLVLVAIAGLAVMAWGAVVEFSN